MCNILNDFWGWAGITPMEYACHGILAFDKGVEECDFPNFWELLQYAQKIVNEDHLDENKIDELITIMALDNEGEHTLSYIEEYSSKKQLSQIIDMGIVHCQPEARWQIAELLYRCQPERFLLYLSQMTKDEHPCVQKRAWNCWIRLQEEGAIGSNFLP